VGSSPTRPTQADLGKRENVPVCPPPGLPHFVPVLAPCWLAGSDRGRSWSRPPSRSTPNRTPMHASRPPAKPCTTTTTPHGRHPLPVPAAGIGRPDHPSQGRRQLSSHRTLRRTRPAKTPHAQEPHEPWEVIRDTPTKPWDGKHPPKHLTSIYAHRRQCCDGSWNPTV
jgi:hypothetical protein